MSKSRWAVMQRLVIGKEENPMLIRWRIISTPWGGIYLHFIHREDLDRDAHNHPWRFSSLVLKGGYVEEVSKSPGKYPRSLRRHRRGSSHRFPLEWAHKIVSVEPGTVTLVVVGPKVAEWGFYTPQGWVPWHQYESTQGVWSDSPRPS